MPYSTLIQAHELHALHASGAPVLVFDCSFDLAQPQAGARSYQEGHIPGARFADLNRDLSAHDGAPAENAGRHPLPTRAHFAAWLAQEGLNADMQVVVYDRNGCNYCVRLWWMLQWAGHAQVAVLDGGLAAWQAAGYALQSGSAPAPQPGHFRLQAPLREYLSADAVQAGLGGAQTIIDARAAARYLGEVEPLDPVAGHIPGALNRPFGQNIARDGRFKPAALLRAEFDALLQGSDAQQVIHQCGSGVSALPNLLAMELAGLPSGRLFAGSWSEWCSRPERPVAKG